MCSFMTRASSLVMPSRGCHVETGTEGLRRRGAVFGDGVAAWSCIELVLSAAVFSFADGWNVVCFLRSGVRRMRRGARRAGVRIPSSRLVHAASARCRRFDRACCRHDANRGDVDGCRDERAVAGDGGCVFRACRSLRFRGMDRFGRMPRRDRIRPRYVSGCSRCGRRAGRNECKRVGVLGGRAGFGSRFLCSMPCRAANQKRRPHARFFLCG